MLRRDILTWHIASVRISLDGKRKRKEIKRLKIRGLTLIAAVLMLVTFVAPSFVVYGQEATLPDYEVSEGDISFSPASTVHVGTSVTISASIHNTGITWVKLHEDGDYIGGYSFNVFDTTEIVEKIDIEIRVRARDNPVEVTVKIDDTLIIGWTWTVNPGDDWVIKSSPESEPIDLGTHTMNLTLNHLLLAGKLDVDWIKIDQTGVGETYFHAEDYDDTKSSGVNDIHPHNVTVGFYDGDPDAGGTPIGYNSTVGDMNYVHDPDRNVYYIKNNGVATATQSWTAYPAGDYRIYVKVDPGGKIGEGDETNNKANKTIRVEANLTITVTKGGITNPSPGEHTYPDVPSYSPPPLTANVMAYPDPNWVFYEWKLDGNHHGTNYSASTTVTMNADHTLNATFNPTLLVSVKGSGTVNLSLSPGPQNDYLLGTVVNATAVPNPIWVFDHWVLDGSYNGTANPRQVTMDAPHNLTAVFRPPVGGIWVPVDKLALLAPYIGLASTILVATAATAIYIKRRKKKQ